MKKTKQYRAAFSMLELVFVIVILGIISSIGTEVIAQTYESYIVQRAQYRATSKTDLALNQIANRLRYAIPGTVGAKDGATFIPISNVTDPDLKILQWVAYDGDSFEAIDSDSNRKPGWSGFCDLTASSGKTISTPGSNLDLATEIIGKLGGNIANAVIYFPYGVSYNVASGSGETITLDTALPSGSSIYERYKLAWTSYALEVDGNNDLILHYNFSPTVGVAISGSSSILLHNITNFRFKGSEGSLRVKICKEEKIGANANETVHSCKEKVIF